MREIDLYRAIRDHYDFGNDPVRPHPKAKFSVLYLRSRRAQGLCACNPRGWCGALGDHPTMVSVATWLFTKALKPEVWYQSLLLLKHITSNRDKVRWFFLFGQEHLFYPACAHFAAAGTFLIPTCKSDCPSYCDLSLTDKFHCFWMPLLLSVASSWILPWTIHSHYNSCNIGPILNNYIRQIRVFSNIRALFSFIM